MHPLAPKTALAHSPVLAIPQVEACQASCYTTWLVSIHVEDDCGFVRSVSVTAYCTLVSA